jgi:hypothetical protein
MSGWDVLDAELGHWQETGRVATFWWRDDDAGRAMPALDRLLALAANHDVPLGLAVIPATLDDLAVRRITAEPLATPLLHGLRHQNHARAGEKKSEFPASRGVDVMLGDLRYGLSLLQAAFSIRVLRVLVPPWNRLAPELIPLLRSIGLVGLSRYLARGAVEVAPRLRQANCHVDLIDWPGARGFIGEAAALKLICDHLVARRSGAVDAEEPTGILSHHLVHDEACWLFLDAVLARLVRHSAARLVAPTTLFLEAANGG